MEAYFSSDDSITLTTLARKIALKTKISESTVKWNLRLLRDVGLLSGGSISRKNVPFKISEAGRVLVEHILESESFKH